MIVYSRSVSVGSNEISFVENAWRRIFHESSSKSALLENLPLFLGNFQSYEEVRKFFEDVRYNLTLHMTNRKRKVHTLLLSCRPRSAFTNFQIINKGDNFLERVKYFTSWQPYKKCVSFLRPHPRWKIWKVCCLSFPFSFLLVWILWNNRGSRRVFNAK